MKLLKSIPVACAAGVPVFTSRHEVCEGTLGSLKVLKLITAITLLVLAGQYAVAQKVPFKHQVLLPKNPSQARNIADFNNDGQGDILVIEGEFDPHVLSWYEAPNWKEHHINDASLKTLHYVADSYVTDLDGDGDTDIIIPDAHEDGPMRVLWYENPLIGKDSTRKGGATQERATQERAAQEWTAHVINDMGNVSWFKDIEVDDLNNDGLPDVAIRGEHDFYVLYQDGGPDKWTTVHFPVKAHEGLAAGDIDRDGFIDLVSNGFWLKNPGSDIQEAWGEHPFDPKWYDQNTDSWQDNNVQVRTGDINTDGLLDIIISNSEKPGYPVSWYQAPNDAINGTWREHVIDTLDYCHSLQIADFDNDGDQDVLAAEMVKGDDPDKMILYLNDGAPKTPNAWKSHPVTFTPQTIQTVGAYWAIAGDLGGDGDIDILTSRSYDEPPVEFWENTLSDKKQSLDQWTYIQVDNDRHAWGEFEEPEWLKYFGVAAGDMSHDGQADIVSGRYCYLNPGGPMTGAWKRIDFGKNVDAMLITDVDGDDYGDVIAEALPNVYWLEAANKEGTQWTITQVAQVPSPGHHNSQGSALAQVIPGGKPEILLEGGDGVYCLQIPADPEGGGWTTTKLTGPGTHAEGIGTGDIDGDGLIDLATGRGWLGVVWWKNPGDGSGHWIQYEAGQVVRDYVDKLAIADINGDGRNDIIAAEELYPDIKPAHIYWFEQPYDPTGEPSLFNWKRHDITGEKFTLNNMNVADMDADGDPDVVTAEHAGSKNTFIYENDGKGHFTEHLVGQGKEGHGGAYVFDIDGDGDKDIINITWDDYKLLHLFRNDAIKK